LKIPTPSHIQGKDFSSFHPSITMTSSSSQPLDLSKTGKVTATWECDVPLELTADGNNANREVMDLSVRRGREAAQKDKTEPMEATNNEGEAQESASQHGNQEETAWGDDEDFNVPSPWWDMKQAEASQPAATKTTVEKNKGRCRYLKLPPVIQKKQALVNLHDYKDNYCFVYAAAAALQPQLATDKHRNYGLTPRLREFAAIRFPKYEQAFNYPLAVPDIPKFAQKYNLRVNVIEHNYDEITKKLSFSFVCAIQKEGPVVNLFYLCETKGNGHYYWIKNLPRMLNADHNNWKFCTFCLNRFKSKHATEKHVRQCEIFTLNYAKFPKV
jgi:hypothetical protein